MTKPVNILLVQLNPVVGDLPGNLGKIRKVRDEAAPNVDLILFPEMIVTGYSPEDLVLKPFFLRRVEDGVHRLVEESKGDKRILAVAAPWREGSMTYNAVILIRDGVILQTIAKHHLPNYGVFDELRVFAPAPLPKPVEIGGCKVGLMVCEDMWFADASAHLKAHGAEILVVVNGSPYEASKDDLRVRVAGKRVAETGLPLVYLNQVGGQDELVFDGSSFMLDHTGKIVLQLEEFAEDRFSLELRHSGAHWRAANASLARTHTGAESIYMALVLGLRDYVRKNGFPGVLIGLSGGIDSALCATLAVDALGAETVHAVMMPSPYTSQASLDDAAALATNLGIRLDSIGIEDPMRTFGDLLSGHFDESTPGITFENIQSRCRGLILMALSNSSGKMVLSTGNKSEMAVGYATLYGDMCGGFNPLKDLYKMQVYELARWRNAHRPSNGLGPEGAIIPDNIITRAPSAELKADQTDQDSLPPYDVLDDILSCLIEKDMGRDEIVARGHSRELVLRVWRLLDMAEYKRRQAPPGIKITSRAFGRDRRYPVTNHFSKADE
ncbi:MAG: NAD+ synthase [Alphaproteobacteria bacterium]|nr:NAD+ synthase [Alphaproteobacteria bacterium]